MIFASRRGGSAHFLEWRIRLFGVAAILAVFGIGAEQGWMVNLAIGVLAVAMVLGWIAKRRADEARWAEEAEGDDDDHDEPLSDR